MSKNRRNLKRQAIEADLAADGQESAQHPNRHRPTLQRSPNRKEVKQE